jgi:hypothetical protein
LLHLVARVYEEEYGEVGIVDDVDVPWDEEEESNRKSKPKGVNGWGPRRGSDTPKSQVDITPVTTCEWSKLLDMQCKADENPRVGLLSTSTCLVILA